MTRRPAQARSRQTYQSIVQAGFIVVAENGIQASTTRRIADVAGIGVASIYEYFKNKDEIFDAMSEQLAEELAELIKGLTPTLVRVSLEECVHQLIVRMAELLQQNNERYLKCLQESLILERLDRLGKVYRALKNLFTEHTFKHPEHLQLPNLPVVAYVLINSGVFTTIRYLSQANPMFSLDDFARGIAKMGGHYVHMELKGAN